MSNYMPMQRILKYDNCSDTNNAICLNGSDEQSSDSAVKYMSPARPPHLQFEALLGLVSNHHGDGEWWRRGRRWRVADMKHPAPNCTHAVIENEIVDQRTFLVERLCPHTGRSPETQKNRCIACTVKTRDKDTGQLRFEITSLNESFRLNEMIEMLFIFYNFLFRTLRNAGDHNWQTFQRRTLSTTEQTVEGSWPAPPCWYRGTTPRMHSSSCQTPASGDRWMAKRRF